MADARAVPVLMYHHVSPSPGLITVSPETFRAQIGWLAGQGWRGIGCDELGEFMRGARLPAKSVLITFDDGYLDNWVHAAPILAEFGMRGTIFLITGRIGDGAPRAQAGSADAPPCPDHRTCMRRIADDDADSVMLRWSEVAALRDAGLFEFHSHTHSHTRWDKVEPDDATRGRRLAEDLATSREALARHCGSVSDHLCWPQGYFDSNYIATAQRNGFLNLHTTEPGTVTSATQPECIPRIVVKDKAGSWFASRLWLYRHPRLSALYQGLKRK